MEKAKERSSQRDLHTAREGLPPREQTLFTPRSWGRQDSKLQEANRRYDVPTSKQILQMFNFKIMFIFQGSFRWFSTELSSSTGFPICSAHTAPKAVVTGNQPTVM